MAPTLRRAFSLIELIIVICIVGILAAVAIPRLSHGVAGAADSALTGDLAMLRTALENYARDHNGAFPTAAAVTSQLQSFSDISGNVSASKTASAMYGPYLTILPTDPVGPRSGSSGIAASDAQGIGWIYNASTGAIQANTTTAADATGTLYSAY